MNYTPSTVLESAGRTPPPITTPSNKSFSDSLAYIDEKLLQLASVQRKSKPFEYGTRHFSLIVSATKHTVAPRFPPGLTPDYNTSVDVHHSFLGHHTIEVEQTRQVTHLFPLNPVRRSHSKMVREENESSPSETWPNIPHRGREQPAPEHDMKRRKLIKHDSTVSMHKFIAKEPASLRKAKSLVAGEMGFVPQQPAATSAARPKALPITVPTIWPQDAALVRLRNLATREALQRADDLKHMMAAQQPSACKFDLQIYIKAVDWILSVSNSPYTKITKGFN